MTTANQPAIALAAPAPAPKPKPVRMNQDIRLQLINGIMRSIFKPTLDKLKADMEARAQTIVRRAYPEFFALYENKEVRHWLAYCTANDFSYTHPNETGTHKLYVPQFGHKQAGRIRTFEDRLVQLHVERNRYGECAERIRVLSPDRPEAPPRLNANDVRSIEALNKRARDIEKAFNDVRGTLVSAVFAFNTVPDFYAAYPELSEHSSVEQYLEPAITAGTALAPAHDVVVGKFVALGLLKAA